MNKKGLALSEILIAIVIISLAMIPSINMIFMFRNYTIHTEDVSIATHLANEKIEEYKHLDFRVLTQFDGNQENGPVVSQKNPMGFRYDSHIFNKFKRKVQIKTNHNGDKNQAMITVHVWWHEKVFDMSDLRYIKLSALKTNEKFF